MVNQVYGKGRQKFLEGSINWLTDTIKAVFVRSSGGGAGPYYTVSIDVDEFFSAIPNNTDAKPEGTGQVGEALFSKTSTLGVADAGDTRHNDVPTGDAVQLIIIYKDSGVAATSPLLAKIDVATNLPFTPNGGDQKITWDTGANKIFKL